MKHIALLILLVPLFFSGCVSVQPGADPVVVNAERSIEVARATLDGFLRFEYNNRAKVPEEMRKSADKIREHAPAWFERVLRLKAAYKQNRGADQKADLMTAVAVLQSAAAEAATILAHYQH